MKIIQADLLLDAQAVLGEGPVWKEDEQALYWVDIPGSKLHRTIPGTDGGEAQDTAWQTPMMIGCFAFTPAGRILAAGSNGFGYLKLVGDRAEFEPICDPEADKPFNRFNDGKCDARGRFLAGTMASTRDGVKTPGGFYVLEPSGECRQLLWDVGISNGLAFTPDSSTLYYIDTATQEIVSFDYGLDHGTIANRKVIRYFDAEGGRPDGMTIDHDGNLWVSFFGGGKIQCIRPQDGESLAEIRVPSLKTTSCCFGGPDYKSLFITSARIGVTDEELAERPYSGGIFVARPGASGEAFPFYGG